MPDHPLSYSPSPIKYSEDWAATRFTDRYGEAVRFVHSTKRWMYWTAQGWQWDKTLTLQNLIRDVCRDIAVEARTDPGLNGAQRAQTAQRFSSGRIIYGIELILRAEPAHGYIFPKSLASPEYPPAPANGVCL